MGFRLLCTERHRRRSMAEHGIAVEVVRKIHEGRPNVLDYLANGSIALIVNTPKRQGGPDRRGPHPRQRRLARRALHHDDRRRQGGRRRHGDDCGRGSSRSMRCRIC